jgi:uncharacterized membrane protein YfcA
VALAAILFGLAVGLGLGMPGGGGSVMAVPVLVYATAGSSGRPSVTQSWMPPR